MKFYHRMVETFGRTKSELHLKAKDILTRLAFLKLLKFNVHTQIVMLMLVHKDFAQAKA